MYYSYVNSEIDVSDYVNSLVDIIDTIDCKGSFVDVKELFLLLVFQIKINGVSHKDGKITLKREPRKLPDHILKLQMFDSNFEKYFSISSGYFYKLDMQYFEGKEVINIPDGINILYLADKSFKNTTLKEAHIPSSVRVIGEYAFAYTSNLEYVDIPDSVRKFGVGAFWSSGLKQLKLPEKIVEWANAVFGECNNLGGTIKIPDGVEDIPFRAFFKTKIKKVILGEDIISIDRDAFRFVDSLEVVDFSRCVDLRQISEGSFASCSNLKRLELPDTVGYVGECSIAYCDNLEELVLPNKIITKQGVVLDCPNIKKIYVRSGKNKFKRSFLRDCFKDYEVIDI